MEILGKDGSQTCFNIGKIWVIDSFSFFLDKGGFHHFLQGHPGLKLSRRHVYVKSKSGKPAVTF